MYKFSSKTEVNKEYKLSEFLTQIKASKEVRNDAKKIKSIKFKNVINASTMNFIEDKVYKNIYVIEIELLEPEVPKIFVEELDKSISFHTYFVFKFENEISTLIAYKDIGSKVIVDKYYCHEFSDEEELELPILNSIADIYKLLLAYETRVPFVAQETPGEYISRVKKINKLNFQISKTEKAIIYESQPKKKFEYNDRLRKYKKDLKELLKVED